jgi:hypothetical protein
MRAPIIASIHALLALTFTSEARAALTLPEAPLPPPRDIRETGESPLYYRIPPRFVGISFRIGFGGNGRLALDGAQGKIAFAFDVLAGASFRFSRTSKLGALAELGYTYIGFGEHLAQLGLGLLLHGPREPDEDDPRRGVIGVALVPHGVLGSNTGHVEYGERTDLLFSVGVLGVDLGHQLTMLGDHPTHQIHVSFMFVTFDGVR